MNTNMIYNLYLHTGQFHLMRNNMAEIAQVPEGGVQHPHARAAGKQVSRLAGGGRLCSEERHLHLVPELR